MYLFVYYNSPIRTDEGDERYGYYGDIDMYAAQNQ